MKACAFGSDMELKQYWQILWKRRWWVVLAFLAIVVATGVVTMQMPPVYQASTKLLLEQKDKTLSAVGQEMAEFTQLSSLSRTGSPLDTQSELIKLCEGIERCRRDIELVEFTTRPII